jgi:hypothetical protein
MTCTASAPRGLITRIPHTHRNKITDHGLHAAMYLSAVHDRLLPTGPARLTKLDSKPGFAGF